MRRIMAVAVVAVLVLAVVALPATAADDAAEVTDPCGLTDRSDVTAPPFQDICTVDIDSDVDGEGSGTVTVTIALDGMVQDRVSTYYGVSFRMGGCAIYLSHHDSSVRGDVMDRVQASCETAREVECDIVFGTLGFTCYEFDEPTLVSDITTTFTDTTVSWTVSAAEFPVLADQMTAGTVIEEIWGDAATNLAGMVLYDGRCDGDGCVSTTGDFVWNPGVRHVIS